jgi:hypothetical protein
LQNPPAAKTVTLEIPAGITLCLAKQWPRVPAGTLGNAEAIFARMPLGRFIGNPWDHMKHVSQDEAHGTADRRIGPVARTEQIHIRVHSDIISDRTADDQERRRAASTGRRPVEVESRLVHGLECGDQDWEIFRQAAGHDGVDSGRMHRQLQPGGGMGGDHRFWRPSFVGERCLDPVGHGRDHRQAIGPPLLVAVIEGAQGVVRNFVDTVGLK